MDASALHAPLGLGIDPEMLGIGELVLLLLLVVFAGGTVARFAGRILFRRSPVAKKVLSVLLESHEERDSGRRDDGKPPATPG